jgi:hypothetical protein
MVSATLWLAPDRRARNAADGRSVPDGYCKLTAFSLYARAAELVQVKRRLVSHECMSLSGCEPATPYLVAAAATQDMGNALGRPSAVVQRWRCVPR